MNGEVVKFPPCGQRIKPTAGSAGLATQGHGAIASVSNLASASGGIKPGNFIQRDAK